MDDKKRSTLALKGISIFLGILLWLFVTNENVIVTRHTVSGVGVTAENLGAGLKAVYNNTVDLEVADNKAVDRTLFQATLDLEGMGPGKHQVPVHVKTPEGVKLLKVAPAEMTVNLMEVNEKVVAVEVRVDQEPPAGYRMTGLIPSPAQVLVRGGYPDVLKVTAVRGYANLSAVKAAATIPLTFTPVDSAGRAVASVAVIPTEGQAYVVVEADKTEDTRPVKAETTGVLPEGYEARITVEPETVKVFGTQEALGQLTEVVTEPVAIEGLTAGLVQEVKLVTVPGVVLNPSSVTVNIEIIAGSATP